MLKDAGIYVIFVSKTMRATQIAEPLEKALNGRVHPKKDYDSPIALLHTDHAHDRVLIVSHYKAAPKLLKTFGYSVLVKSAPLEYDRLFVNQG